MPWLLLLQADFPQSNLSTIAGVVAASFVLTEVAKRYITPKMPVVGQIPVMVFPLVISLTLAILANKVFKDNQGKPFLEGNIWTVLIGTFTSAASASGLFTWLKYPSTTVGDAQPLGTPANTGEDTKMKPNPLILLPFLMLLVGCSCPQKAVLRESMDQATSSIQQDHKDWAKALVAYPIGQTDPRTGQPSTGKNQADQIPPLTPAQYNQILATHNEYEQLVAEDRARDSAPAAAAK